MASQPPERDKPGDEVPEDAPSAGANQCPECGGSGEVDGETCEACRGTGRVEEGVGGG